MAQRRPVPWSRRLTRLVDGGELSVTEVAQKLLALREPVEVAAARRLLSAALGVAESRVPQRLARADVPRLLYGPVADVPLATAEFVVVDLETTGLSVERARILEIGAVHVQRQRPCERFALLCDPGERIPARITALTGIDADSVVGAPPLRQAVRRFSRWLEARPAACFVAHNANFDESFVRRALQRYRLPALERPVLCTRKLARRLVPELRRYGLDGLCARFGISNAARHRALGDAEATAAALLDLLALARERLGLKRLGELLDLQDRPPPALGKSLDRASAQAVR